MRLRAAWCALLCVLLALPALASSNYPTNGALTAVSFADLFCLKFLNATFVPHLRPQYFLARRVLRTKRVPHSWQHRYSTPSTNFSRNRDAKEARTGFEISQTAVRA